MKKILIVSLLVSVSLLVFADLQWKTEVNTDADKRANQNAMVMTTYAKGGDVKQVFTEVKNKRNPYYSDSVEWLYKGKTDTFYLINHDEKTYTPMELDFLLQMSQMAGDMVNISISDYNVSHENLPGETILGYPCKHIRIVTDYTMTIKVAVIKKVFQVHEEKEIWGTRQIKGLDAVAPSFLNKDFKTGFEGLDEMIASQTGLYKKIGFPLKTITASIQKNKKGKVMGETTTTQQVVEIKQKTLAPSLFTLPEGYTEESMAGPEEQQGLKGLFKKDG